MTNNFKLEYQLIRSKRRKTLSLQVKGGKVVVRAPYHVAATFIDTFIDEKSAWLHAKVLEQHSEVNYCKFTQGSILLFLGEQLTLNIYVAKQASIFIASNLAHNIESFGSYNPCLRQLNVVISEKLSIKLIEPLVKAERVKKLLEIYFKQQAEQLIIERLELLSAQTCLSATKVNIRQYRARWGSCNNRGELSFNYLLMMAPVFVIDYVIIHELCHLKHLNHSKDFWQLVKQYSPSYQVAKDWLKTHQSQLSWEKPR